MYRVILFVALASAAHGDTIAGTCDFGTALNAPFLNLTKSDTEMTEETISSIIDTIPNLDYLCSSLQWSIISWLCLFYVERDWHEVERTANELESGDCVAITFANEQTKVSISIREVLNKTVHWHNGTVVNIASGTEVARVNFTDVQLDIRVLKSDYKNYALLYGCKNVGNNTKAVYGWKLARTATLSSIDIAAINQAINGSDLQNAAWKTISHTEESCKVNSATAIQISTLILMFVAAVVGENSL